MNQSGHSCAAGFKWQRVRAVQVSVLTINTFLRLGWPRSVRRGRRMEDWPRDRRLNRRHKLFGHVKPSENATIRLDSTALPQ
jgi:hypothetical protein